MLQKFEVRNFKNFNDWFVFDLSRTKDYQFNPECVRSGIVKTSILYGPNGCGKTNLGRAIFDIKTHLSDTKIDDVYHLNYLNAESKLDIAEFRYTFSFMGKTLTYVYGKTAVDKIAYERLSIEGEELLFVDRRTDSILKCLLPGTEKLNKNLADASQALSAVKYVWNNSILESGDFQKMLGFLFEFVDLMILDRVVSPKLSGSTENFVSLLLNPAFDLEGLNVKDFEDFLNESGVKCSLAIIKTTEGDRLAFDFNGRKIDFLSAASTGTIGLTDFYCWWNWLKSASASKKHLPFMFFDEFDAFYHNDLADSIVKLLRGENCQAVMTTHNTGVMSNDLLRPDCYFSMSEKEIKPLYEFTSKELRWAHNLEKMYRSGVFDG